MSDPDVNLRQWAVEMAVTNASVMSRFTLDSVMDAAQRFYDFAKGAERSPGAYTPSAYGAPAHEESRISEGHL